MIHALVRAPGADAVVDGPAVRAELAGLHEHEWVGHPGGLLGDAAIPLVAVGGTVNLDYALAGPLRTTAVLERGPALARVLARLGVPLSRTRLVRLAAGSVASFAGEHHYHWFRRTPLCIPLVSEDQVALELPGAALQLRLGEAWLLDPERPLRLRNDSGRACVHLVAELREPSRLGEGTATEPAIEGYRFEVLTPAEVAALCEPILRDADEQPLPAERLRGFSHALAQVQVGWQAAFERFGHHPRGELAYRDLILDVREQIMPRLTPGSAGMRAATILTTMLEVSPPRERGPLLQLHRPPRPRPYAAASEPHFDRPLFIVSPPRSGSTLLFDLMARLPAVWTLGGESHALIRAIPELHPVVRGWVSDGLGAAEATPELAARLRRAFASCLRDRAGVSLLERPEPARPSSLRLVEKTPANALRIPFLRAVFPGARFVQLRRDPRATISSLVEGWRSRRFIAHRTLPGWPHRDWSFLLPPGWQRMVGRSLVEIAAFQWEAATTTIAAELAALPESEWMAIDYDALLADPRRALERITHFAELAWDQALEHALAGSLAPTHVTLSAPAPDKWRRHEHELAELLPTLTLLAGDTHVR